MYELILVSESPRRRDILNKSGFIYLTDSLKISEFINENINLTDAIIAVSRQKSEAYVEAHKSLENKEILVLTADTVVVFDGKAYGKPKNNTQAIEFIQKFNGKMHSVITAVTLFNFKYMESFSFYDSTDVYFKCSTDQEINDYVNSGEPMGKAGAYAIQGLGQSLVEKINGSFNNVVGLPIEKLIEVLDEKSWVVDRRKS